MGIDKHQIDALLKWKIRESAGIIPMDLALPYQSLQTINRFRKLETKYGYQEYQGVRYQVPATMVSGVSGLDQTSV